MTVNEIWGQDHPNESGKGGRLLIPANFPISSALKIPPTRKMNHNFRGINSTARAPAAYHCHWLSNTCLTCLHHVAAPLQPRCCHSNLNTTALDSDQYRPLIRKRDKAAIHTRRYHRPGFEMTTHHTDGAFLALVPTLSASLAT